MHRRHPIDGLAEETCPEADAEHDKTQDRAPRVPRLHRGPGRRWLPGLAAAPHGRHSSASLKVMLPVAASAGLSRTTYVPVALRSSVSERPVGLTRTAASVEPFGRRITTCEEEIETAESTRETRRPAVP